MRLRQIEVFYAVYSTRSMVKAAEFLGVSQPAISKVLRHTEDTLGYTLFERTASGLLPTREAAELFEGATRVFFEVSRFRARAGSISGGADKPLRIALAPSIGLSTGPKAVARYSAANPDMSIEIETFHFEQAVDALRAELTDIAIAYQPYPREGVRITPMCEAKFVCITPRGHWPDRNGRIRARDLATEPLIYLNVDAPLGHLLSTHLNNVSKMQHPQRITVNTYYIARMLVANGAGLAIVDEYAARAPATDDIDIYEFEDEIRLSVGAIVRENYSMSQAEQAFLETLAGELNAVSATVI